MARRKVIRVRIKGKLMTLREVSEKYHISPELLRYRYKHKMRGDELLCGRKDSKSKDEVEYMKSQIKDEEKEREKIRKKAILNLYQRNVRAEYEEERKRRKKPHLFNVPQKHSRDPYWFDNTYNQMFKKWSEA
ncbi:DNA polymerase [Staphylococcus aureus]|uniref:SA1788 family PVL leukocidin-associated protein n=1 Tax=Staphylococcus aureus TaxID=1280 RepID=UPI002875DA66|nr:SA1788 family PVL leukocidin-associated protein [Staphylococcus aureus]MDS1257092.1 DNA polymerase [Staphylococcus aureus]